MYEMSQLFSLQLGAEVVFIFINFWYQKTFTKNFIIQTYILTQDTYRQNTSKLEVLLKLMQLQDKRGNRVEMQKVKYFIQVRVFEIRALHYMQEKKNMKNYITIRFCFLSGCVLYDTKSLTKAPEPYTRPQNRLLLFQIIIRLIRKILLFFLYCNIILNFT